jgi:hypothetical protein
MSSRVAPSRCPECHVLQDGATGITDPKARPKVGDYAVCTDCGSFLRFGVGLILQPLSIEDIAALKDEERIAMQQGRRFVEERLKPNKGGGS